MSSNLTIAFVIPPFSHNVTTKRNKIIGWIPGMANVFTKNSDAWHITLAAPIKLVGALDLRIELGPFFDTPLKIDAPMELGMVFVNTNDYGSHI